MNLKDCTLLRLMNQAALLENLEGRGTLVLKYMCGSPQIEIEHYSVGYFERITEFHTPHAALNFH